MFKFFAVSVFHFYTAKLVIVLKGHK